MNRKILPVKPISQLFPIPMVMGCEGVSAAIMLQYNNQHIPATEIMRHWPTHPNNPHKGYVGHVTLIIKLRQLSSNDISRSICTIFTKIQS